MPTLTELQDAAVAHIKAKAPGLRQCAPYAGQFAGEPGARVAIHAPAVLVAALDARPASPADVGDGRMDVTARMAAYCLARHAGDPGKREGACQDLAANVALAVSLASFGLADTGCARVIDMKTLTDARADQAGFALWAVTWEQELRLGAAAVESFGPITELRVGLAPNVGAGHETDYARVNG